MSNLATIANVAEILGGLTIVIGGIFAVVQLREIRAQRRQAAAVELLRSFQDPLLSNAVALINELPDGISAEALRAKGPEYERAAVLISTTYETIALLVYREMASYSLVRDLTGGLTVVMWKKLETFTRTLREELDQPSWAEWFQWLAEHLARDRKEKEENPAYERYAGWKPRD